MVGIRIRQELYDEAVEILVSEEGRIPTEEHVGNFLNALLATRIREYKAEQKKKA